VTGRTRLPNRRRCCTVSARVAGMSVHVSAGFYPDGRIGEVFVVVAKAGSVLRGLLDEWSVNTSIALQYGVPLSVLVAAGIERAFEPAGTVEWHPTIKECTSLTDYVVRALEEMA
jgi:ribonucleoside-diphosphate reductase alpha chain